MTDKNKEFVKLTPEQYNALMDRLDELESKQDLDEGDEDFQPGDDLVSRLANATKKGASKSKASPIDFNNMSMQEFATYIQGYFTTQILQPIAVAVEAVKLEIEEDKLTRDGKTKNFDKVKADVYETAKNNPNLTLKQSYELVLKEKGLSDESEEGETEEEVNKNKSGEENKKPEQLRELIKNLPARETKIHGEKPRGNSPAANESTEPETTREAAEEAWNELGLKD